MLIVLTRVVVADGAGLCPVPEGRVGVMRSSTGVVRNVTENVRAVADHWPLSEGSPV